jgi:hypothetical protein
MKHVDGEALGELALGLLEDDPAVEGGPELLSDGLAAPQAPFLQQPDDGHVGEGLADAQVRRAEGTGDGADRFSVPMTWSHSRIGTASTVRNPAWMAAAANRGYR